MEDSERRPRAPPRASEHVLMAMRKEPHRRYASVEQLAEDLRRHLAGHPVLARKDTLLYRWSKFVRRHRVGVAAAGAFVAACLAFGVVMGVQRDQIARERDRAERIQRFLTDLLQGADPLRATGDGVTVVDLLDEGARRLETEMAELPEVRADLSETLGVTYKHLGHFDKAERAFERALDLRLEIFGPRNRKVAGDRHPLLGWNTALLATLHDARGDPAGCERLARQAVDVLAASQPEGHWQTATAEATLGSCLLAQGRWGEAEPLLLRSRDALGQTPSARASRTLSRVEELLLAVDRARKATPRRSPGAGSPPRTSGASPAPPPGG